MTRDQIISTLYKVSANLLLHQMSEDGDYGFTKTMPLSDKKRVRKACEKHNEFLRRQSISIKEVIDQLQINDSVRDIIKNKTA